MEFALLAARLLLAVVFVVAGVTKLADRAGSRQAMLDFGVPARLVAPFGILLPLAELAVAVTLIPVAAAWWGAVGALWLLLLFVAGIGVSLARGRKPDCHCFGQLHSEPVGWPTLVRNGLLAALAGFIVWQGWERNYTAGPSAFGWLGDLTIAERVGVIGGLVALGLLGAMVWLLVHLLGQNGRLLLRLEALEARLATGGAAPEPAPAEAPAPPEPGLPVGTPAPAFALTGLYRETLTLDALRAPGKPVLLFFSDPNCGPCNALLPDLGRWQGESGAKVTMALISRGTPEANRAKSTEHGLTNVLLQRDREVAEAYEANGTPSAVLVRPDGTIGSPLAAGADAIRLLVARTVGLPNSLPVPSAAPAPAATAGTGNGAAQLPQALAMAPRPAGSKVGEPAPPLALPDLTGKTVTLDPFRGSKTLVLFWNPGCGFCQRMLDDLKAWETNPPSGAPKLLVVSTGSVESNRALGFRSPVVLDQTGNAMSAFGTNGTPTAVLVDAQGKIASELAAGAPAVLALAGAQPHPTGSANGNHGTARPAAPKVGERAAAIKLPDLTGKNRTLAEFRGSKTLVLFWNPGCGFCQRMLDDLKAWEANPPKGAPKLLVVSSGTLEDNRALGLKSPVLLDPNFSAGPQFGVNGTPSAVLVDAKGNIASEVAVGAPAVLALANPVSV